MKLKREEFDIVNFPGPKQPGGQGGTPPPQPKWEITLPDTEDQDKNDGEGEGEEGEGQEGEGQEGQGSSSGSGKKKKGELSDDDLEDDYPNGDDEEGLFKDDNEDGAIGDDLGVGGILTREEAREITKELGLDDGDDGEDGNLSDEEWEKKWLKAGEVASTKLRKAGNERGGLLLRTIAARCRPQKDWKRELRKFVGKAMSNSDLFFGSRRHIYKGDYRYGLKDTYEALEHALVCVDTSGSMGGIIPIILGEVKNIFKEKKVKAAKIVYFDTEVTDVDDMKTTKRDFDPDKVKGGGGTLFKPALKYCLDEFKKNRCEIVLFCTDGENGDNPLPIQQYNKLMVWIIIDNPSWKCPWGMAVYISSRDVFKNN